MGAWPVQCLYNTAIYWQASFSQFKCNTLSVLNWIRMGIELAELVFFMHLIHCKCSWIWRWSILVPDVWQHGYNLLLFSQKNVLFIPKYQPRAQYLTLHTKPVLLSFNWDHLPSLIAECLLNTTMGTGLAWPVYGFYIPYMLQMTQQHLYSNGDFQRWFLVGYPKVRWS